MEYEAVFQWKTFHFQYPEVTAFEDFGNIALLVTLTSARMIL